jgi:hypothetical protein
MPCRDPTSRDQPRLVTAIGRAGGRILETDVKFGTPEAAAAIQGKVQSQERASCGKAEFCRADEPLSIPASRVTI